jgi:hypothetical protein
MRTSRPAALTACLAATATIFTASFPGTLPSTAAAQPIPPHPSPTLNPSPTPHPGPSPHPGPRQRGHVRHQGLDLSWHFTIC